MLLTKYPANIAVQLNITKKQMLSTWIRPDIFMLPLMKTTQI